MTQVVGSEQAEKSFSKVVQVAGMGMSLMGSSAAHVDAHIDHGYSSARWGGVLTSLAGFVCAGFGIPFRIWPLVVVGAMLQLAAIVVAVVMNKAGHGHASNSQWAALKAEAKAARLAVEADA